MASSSAESVLKNTALDMLYHAFVVGSVVGSPSEIKGGSGVMVFDYITRNLFMYSSIN
jgi:hypothetical protein